MCKVSIIIPVYNSEKTLHKCLDSLSYQTFKNFEVICVNDGSTDKSLSILQKYAREDSRFKVFNRKHFGPGNTRNFAISISSGKYLMFCDCDDWYEKNMVEVMYKTILKEKVDVAMCEANFINDNISKKNTNNYFYENIKIVEKNLTNIIIYGKHKIQEKDYLLLSIVLWNKIIKKSLIDKYNITFPNTYSLEDNIFLLKLLFVTKNCFGIDKKLYNHTIQKNSTTNLSYKKIKSNSKIGILSPFEDLLFFISKFNNKKKKNFYYKIIVSILHHAFVVLSKKDKKIMSMEIEKFFNFASLKYNVSVLKYFYTILNLTNKI